MRKQIILLLAALMSVGVMAQEHMKFKGIEMTGTPQAFAQKLVQKGFRNMGTKDGVLMLKGDFAGYKECEVYILGTQNAITKIAVAFPECNNWNRLFDIYSTIKNMLTQKYGEPEQDVVDWQTYSEPRSDNDRWTYLTMDMASIYSSFSSSEGKIALEMVKLDYDACCVMLHYFDEINTVDANKPAMDDL